MIKHAMRVLLVVSAASLLFACGSGGVQQDTQPAAQAKSARVMSQALPQCSDGATIAGGDYHTVGLKTDGTVSAVGYNGSGQLNVASWTNMKAVAARFYQTVGLKGDGTVTAVGFNGYGQLNVAAWTNVKAVAAGAYHTLGIKDDGSVVAVGYNLYGQLNVSSWANVNAVAAGTYHTVGVKDDGTVVAVGNNSFGQLNVSSWANIKAVAAGAYHTVGLKDDGTVVAAGYNNYGQANVSSWTGIKAVAAGTYHTVGLRDDGTVVAAGNNSFGQLNVSSWTNIKAVAAGAYHTLGLKDDGTVVAAGYNSYGQSNVSSWTGMMPICDSVCAVNQDVTAPVTSVTVTGTPGSNGWYVSDVQMTLTAADEAGGSGVKEIHYTIDGTETVVQGDSASQTIVGDGSHAVTYFAVDNAGNVEAAHAMNVNIDKTPPSVYSLFADPAILWPPNHKMTDVMLNGAVTDKVSGVASTVVTVTDEYGIYNMTVPGLGSAIQLEAWRLGQDMDGRVYTITVVATDNAGNKATGTTTVVVPHDKR